MILKEYGGYIELDTYKLPMLHDDAIALNSGRNALAYLLEAKNIKKLVIPYFLCDSVPELLKRENVSYRFYHIDINFRPEKMSLNDDEWLYIVNFYGQLDREYLGSLKKLYRRIIIDNAQNYFEAPLEDTDVLYTCRKFFGVADGAFLYSDTKLKRELLSDESFDRMHFLLGRFERPASEFYNEYVVNNHLFAKEPIKKMSVLTNNLLHGIDYDFVKQRRSDNFNIFYEAFKNINRLTLYKTEGAFMYPLYLKFGSEIRKKLQLEKIYIPTLWPAVFDICKTDMLEYDMALNILPLPVDQRYDSDDIEFIIDRIKAEL